jgi:hypothetical protein
MDLAPSKFLLPIEFSNTDSYMHAVMAQGEAGKNRALAMASVAARGHPCVEISGLFLLASTPR